MVKRTSLNLILSLVVMGFATAALAGTAAAQATLSAAELTARKSLGSRQAPITIEVFSDYQCPQCRLFYENTTRRVIENYVTTGKVYLIHRDFPLAMHPYARQAARWLNAAAAAGHFETVSRALYAKQDEWAATGQIEPVIAAALPPAEMNRVRQIHSTQATALDSAVQSDVSLGTSRRVTGTPTIFVTHRGRTEQLPVGGVTYTLLKQYLDYLLQR